ncbi:MAG: DUF2911 domain-containing protein [Gemmatimonadota bacterium]|nr:DUF2911 domain-containing protein [Gemmatimonadota bacterium]
MSRIAIALALVLASAGGLSAQKPEEGAWIVRLGRDTVAVERYKRTGDAISLEQVLHTPQTSLRHTHLEWTTDGRLAKVIMRLRRVGASTDAPLLGSTTLTVLGDSGAIVVKRGDSTLAPRQIGIKGDAIPAIQLSYLPYEMAAVRLRASKKDSIEVHFLSFSNQPSIATQAKRIGKDSVLFSNQFVSYRAKVDKDGRLLGMHAPGSTFQVKVDRLPAVDINAIATAWVAADEKGAKMGTLSIADSVMTNVGGADIAIKYSRPAKRGRVIFGEIVQWNKVWRTGANSATMFTTSKDLMFGGTHVPAGSYTLWTLPTPTGTTLIINKQTGQWGTEYKPEMDLARIPMTTKKTAEPLERFVIAVEPQGNGGVLKLGWDTMEMIAPFMVM